MLLLINDTIFPLLFTQTKPLLRYILQVTQPFQGHQSLLNVTVGIHSLAKLRMLLVGALMAHTFSPSTWHPMTDRVAPLLVQRFA